MNQRALERVCGEHRQAGGRKIENCREFNNMSHKQKWLIGSYQNSNKLLYSLDYKANRKKRHLQRKEIKNSKMSNCHCAYH